MSSELEERDTPDLKPTIRLLLWLTVCFGVCFIGYLGSKPGLWFWYMTLWRPAWAPPVGIVTPTWLIVFGFSSAASWQIWNAPRSLSRNIGLTMFFVLLGLTGLWPWVFYAWHLGGPSVAAIAVLWVVALVATILFWRIRSSAGRLMLPFLGWVAYLAIVDAVVWRLNQ